MPVIREKKNFSIGPVGVTRASEAGRITGQAITQSANQIGEMFFEKAAKQAEEFGLKEGASVDREQVIAINPQTGEPEAYEPPQGLGSIGADAYQRVVMTRFQRSIEDEIRNKGQELAVRFEDNANGVALYTSAMSDYISSMTDVAQDEFKGYIADVGTTYLNATRTSMAVAQVRRERAAAARAHRRSVADGLANIESMAAQLGGAAYTNPDSPLNLLTGQVDESITVGGQAGVFDESATAQLPTAARAAGIRGLLTNITNNQDVTSRELVDINAAFNTQSPALIPDKFIALKGLYSSLSDNPAAMRALEAHANGTVGEGIAYRSFLQQEQIDILDAEDLELASEVGTSTYATILGIRRNSADVSPSVLSSRAASAFEAGKNYASDALSLGMDDRANAEEEKNQAVLSEYIRVMANNSFDGLSSSDIPRVMLAIEARDVSLAPPSAQDDLQALIQLEEATGQPVLEAYGVEAQTYKNQRAQVVDAVQAEAEAARLAAEKAAEDARLLAIQQGFNEEEFNVENGVPPSTGTSNGASDAVSNAISSGANFREVSGTILSNFSNATNVARQHAIEGRNALSESYLKVRDAQLNTHLAQLFTRAFLGKGQDDVDVLETILASTNPIEALNEAASDGVISQETADSLTTALAIGEQTNTDALGQATSALGKYREGAGRGFDLLDSQAAEAQLQALSTGMNTIGSAQTSADINANLSTFVTQLDAITNAEPADVKNLREGAYELAARTGLNLFFNNQNLSDGQISLANTVLNGGTDDLLATESERLNANLSAGQIQSLRNVDSNAQEASSPTQITTTLFNELNKDRVDANNIAAQVRSDRSTIASIFDGTANPQDDNTRSIFDTALEEILAESGATLKDILTNPDAVSLYAGASDVLAIISQSSVLPQSAVDVFNAAGIGEVGQNLPYILTQWGSVRSKMLNNTEVRNPSINALEPDVVSALDYLYDFMNVSGSDPQELTETLNLYRRNQQDPVFQAEVKARLGDENLQDFVRQSLDLGIQPSPAVLNTMQAIALRLINLGADDGVVSERLKLQFDELFPSTDGVLSVAGGSDRSSSAPSIFLGEANVPVFNQYSAERIMQVTGDDGVTLGPVRLGRSTLIDMAAVTGEGVADPVRNDYFLRPIGNENGVAAYAVYKQPEDLTVGIARPVFETVLLGTQPPEFARGEPESLPTTRALIIRTNDPALTQQIKDINDANHAQYLAEGRLSKDMQLTPAQRALRGSFVDPNNVDSQPFGNIDDSALAPNSPLMIGARGLWNKLQNQYYNTPYRDDPRVTGNMP